jgi:hypothetical protein
MSNSKDGSRHISSRRAALASVALGTGATWMEIKRAGAQQKLAQPPPSLRITQRVSKDPR